MSMPSCGLFHTRSPGIRRASSVEYIIYSTERQQKNAVEAKKLQRFLWSMSAEEFRAHRVIAILKLWLGGTHQGAVSHEHLQSYLDEFVFRFNRRSSKSRGLLFRRLLENAVLTPPALYKSIVKILKNHKIPSGYCNQKNNAD